ncbi:TetR/AcrR family transcriptional regulator [Mesorhizobium sp. M8A.F.Ca.ET.057.01.1.1]|uniref:TetR/AcrR family transcriptional regulator n=1 Tax=Mesorhizobium sp. M8A.F.Ca.ET.057.01.1.1 TaxID=2493679 RepID=UPI001FE18659|nr:TetR/AcrR family transcriptional regulator [Mesorhizobium sp. M8A.F.Ca.ET.057.01.1.1]
MPSFVSIDMLCRKDESTGFVSITMENSDKQRGGRPRAFDPDRALDAAMHLFWEHGYEATSLAMLREAMGLTPPQIYNAFTDKQTLFRKALTRYHETEIGFALEALSAPVSTGEAMRRLLIGAAEAYSRAGKPGGCLFVSGALAASPQAQTVADELKAYRKASEVAIAARLAKGKAEGDLPQNLSVEDFARYIAGVMNGMSIQARDGASAEELRVFAQTALAALPAEGQNQVASSKD